MTTNFSMRYLTNLPRLICIKVLLLISVNAFGQNIDYARHVIDTLCSPYMAGRGYVEDGDLKAASFIAQEFRNQKLEGYRNSYFQNFSVSVNTFPGALSVIIDGEELSPGIDFIVHQCSPSLDGEFEIVNIKSSWNKDSLRLALELNRHPGKVLAIDEAKLKLNPQELNQLIRKIKTHPQGIAGIILLTDRKQAWTISPYVCPLLQITVRKGALKSIKKIIIQADNEYRSNYKTQNVIGYISGLKNPDSLIVFTAHYDHIGKMGSETIFPGANDNASGIAMLLSLVKYYSAKPPPYTIVFIAFGAEELGLLGSRHFVDNPMIPLENIKFLINMDMVGTGDDGLTVVNGTIFAEEFKVMETINETHQLLPNIKKRGESCRSDHCFFYSKGVPCFFIYTMGGIQAYHDVFDKSETLPLTKFIETCKLLLLFTDHLMERNFN